MEFMIDGERRSELELARLEVSPAVGVDTGTSA